jgi:ABC-2 type transport system permease protein
VRKIIIIAIREYLAAVKTKSFLISLILLPLMMSSGFIAQRLGQKLADVSVKRFAVIDRTPGAVLYGAIAKEVEKHNKNVFDPDGKQIESKFELEQVRPTDPNDSFAPDRQRLELSDRVRSGKLLGYVEIGPDVLKFDSSAPLDQSQDLDSIRYSTNRPTFREFTSLLQNAIQPAIYESRFDNVGLPYQALIKPRLKSPQIVDRGLAQEFAGRVTYESHQGQIASYAIPVALLALMFVVVLVGASPMTANVIEEKTLRIAEVLLGSVTPSQLMGGKLLGGVAVALTLATIYFSGAFYVAIALGLAGYVGIGMILWFIFFTILSTLMYGAMFLAAGAAVTNLKEAQTIMAPLMMMIVLPVTIAAGNVVQDPSGTVATFASFFPFSAPMIMTARIAIPPGVPSWEAALCALVVMLFTLILVWAAGRIFRVGILLHGQGASYAEMVKWIIRG